MKDWWLNLPLREKQSLAIGSIVVILFLLYEIVWSPLSDMNDNLRIRIQHGQITLNSMQNADQLIQHLVKTSQEKHQQLTQSILGTLQNEINKSQFTSHVTQLRQTENESVQMNVNKMNFDQLLAFLTGLGKKYNIIVSQITVMPTGASGEVNADVVVISG